MSYKENLRERRAVTNECYLCFNNLVKPRKCYDKEKYSTLIAFPSTDESTHAKIIAAMRAAFEQAHEKLCENGAELRFEDALTPLKKDCENFDGMYLMNVMTTEKPRLVDSQLKNLKLNRLSEVPEESQFCFAALRLMVKQESTACYRTQ